MATIKRSKTTASTNRKKTVIPQEIFETEARRLNREAMELISKKVSCFRYFVSFALTINDKTVFKNDVVEINKMIKTIDDIRSMEEKITAKLKLSITNGNPFGIIGEIDSVQIINFNRI